MTFTYFGEKSIQEIKPEATGFVEGVLTLVRGVTGGDVVKELMVEGVLSIQAGESPALIERKLNSFMLEESK